MDKVTQGLESLRAHSYLDMRELRRKHQRRLRIQETDTAVLEAKHVFQRRNNDQMLLRDLVRWRLRLNHWVWQWGCGVGAGGSVKLWLVWISEKWEKKFVYWVKTNFEDEFYCREKGNDRGGFWELEKRFLKIKRCLNSGGHDSAERIQDRCWWEREWWQTRP